MTSTAVVAIFAAGVGLGLAILLARFLLGGILGLMYRRVRSLVQRARERRRVARPGADRRRSDQKP